MNSSSDLTYIERCNIQENDADGVKFVHHDVREDVQLDRSNIVDFCTFPTTTSQTFPIAVTIDQGKYVSTTKECSKVSLICSVLRINFTSL